MKVLCLVSPYGAVSSELCQWREFQELEDLILEAASCNSSIFTKAASSLFFLQEDDSTWDVRHTEVCTCGLSWSHGGIYQLISSALLWNAAIGSLLGTGMWSGPPILKNQRCNASSACASSQSVFWARWERSADGSIKVLQFPLDMKTEHTCSGFLTLISSLLRFHRSAQISVRLTEVTTSYGCFCPKVFKSTGAVTLKSQRMDEAI